jgi:hypothetical protein
MTVQEHAAAGSEEDEDADSIPSQDTEEQSDAEHEEEAEGPICATGADAVPGTEPDDVIDVADSDGDADEDGTISSNQGESEGGSGDSDSSGSDGEIDDGSDDADEETDSDEFVDEDVHGNAARRVQRCKQGVGKVALAENGVKTRLAAPSKRVPQQVAASQSESVKPLHTKSRQGISGSNVRVNRGKSRAEKSDGDLPEGLQTICRSFNNRPQGAHTQEDSNKSQSRSSSKKSKSKRAAEAEKLDNAWLRAAVAVGEGTLEDAMELADFVVAQPERDYDSLLRSRYWTNVGHGKHENSPVRSQREKITKRK